MLSYRHFITRLMLIFGGRALKELLLAIIRAENQEQRLQISKSARDNLNQMRYWFKHNPQVGPPEKSIVAGQPVYAYKSHFAQSTDVPIILLHGGGFILGGHESHGALASELAAATGSTVYLVEYPLFPEVSIQEMVQSCKQAVHSLVDNKKLSRYVLFGDSVGGFLASHVTAHRIAHQLSLPERLYLLSPLIQHAFSIDEKAVKPKCKTDDILGPVYELVMNNERVRLDSTRKLGCADVNDLCAINPETLAQFPGVHITYDRDEVLLWEIQEWTKQLKKLGVKLVDNSVDNGFHAFAVYSYLPMSKQYFSEISRDFQKLLQKET